MYSIFLQRLLVKKTNDAKIESQIQYIVGRGIAAGRGKTWDVEYRRFPAIQREDGKWLFKYQINFKKTRGELGGEAEQKQWQEIKAMMQQSCVVTKFQPLPWCFEETTPDESSDATNENENGLLGLLGIKEVQQSETPKSWSELAVPDELLGPESDFYLSQHPAWENLYGVNPQIRILLSNIHRAHKTNGESRNHAVLFGHAGCGKTTTIFGLQQMFGSDSVLKLDATSTTRAGLEKLFFNELQDIPPLVFMEEAEKADPEALKIWLGALDDRGEIRKVNFKVNQLRAVKVLFICTVNNKALFDRMMGSDGSEAGALSSRCVTQIYYPRPSQLILTQILHKEIRERGGSEAWIIPAINLAEQLKISDPRIVRSFLAGGDRLLDGSYQRDWLAVYEAQQAFNKI